MLLEIKSIVRNRIIRSIFIIGIGLAIFQAVQMEEVLHQSGEAVYYGMQSNYTVYRDQLQKQSIYRDQSDPDQKNYIKYLEWLADQEYHRSQLYLQGSEKNQQELEEIDLALLLAVTQLHCGAEDELPVEVFKNEIKKYGIAENLPFSLERLGRFFVKEKEYNESYSKPMFDAQMFQLKHHFTEREKGVRSPWAGALSNGHYLKYVYQIRSARTRLFLPVFIMMSGYILIQAKKEKTFDLLACRAKKKTHIIWHYVGLAFVIASFIFVLTDLLPLIYTGIRYGFTDLNVMMLIYEPGLHSGATFPSLQFSQHEIGLTHLRMTALSNNPDYPYLFMNLRPIPLWDFLLRSYSIEFLRLIFYVLIGVTVGCIVKSERLTVPVLSAVFGIAIASGTWAYLAKGWNVFAIDSGWNVMLGWTAHSWWSSVWLLTSGIISVAVMAHLLIYKRSLR